MIDQKLVIFESNPDFADNSRALYDYIVKSTELRTFWVVKDPVMLKLMRDSGVDCDLVNSDRAVAMEQRAHYLVTSSFIFAYNKRPGQIHISVWHGFGPKTIGFDEDAAANENALRDLKVITTQCDLLTTTSRMSQLFMAGMLSMDPRKVINSGFPRNDYLFATDGRKLLQDALGIDFGNSRLIMYLPTMRKGLKAEGGQFNKNIFNYGDYDVAALDSFLESNDAFIISKMHFADNSSFKRDFFDLPKRVLFLDNLSLGFSLLTIYHVLNAFDALITDYSSVYVDYLLLNRPIIFSCPDFDDYARDRGFISDDPRWMMPGDFVQSQSDLLLSLDRIFSGNDDAASRRASFVSLVHSHIDGRSSQRVFDKMIEMNRDYQLDCDKMVASCFADSGSTLRQYMNLTSKAELYLDHGSGFEAGSVLIQEYSSNCFGSKVMLFFKIPADVQQVRFDPADYGSFLLRDVSFSFTGLNLMWRPVNGSANDTSVVFDTSDPQILVTGFNGEAGELTVTFLRSELGKSAEYVAALVDNNPDAHSQVKSGRMGRFMKFWRR